MAGVAGGLWSVSKSADGHNSTQRCLKDPALLAQWENLTSRCARFVISDEPSHAVMRYTCDDGNYGRSDIRVVTPRSLKVATQGISHSYPFSYTIYARRVGQCAIR